MGFLDFILPKRDGQQQYKAGDILSTEKISAHLREVCSKKARLQLTFDNDKSEYHSIFLEVMSTPSADYLLIDIPPQHEAARLPRARRSATVTYRLGDKQFSFRTILIELMSGAQGGIKVQLPTSISRFERRKDFRVELSPRHPIIVNFKYGREDLIAARAQVKDISAGGLAINTNLKDPLLAPGLMIRDIHFELYPGVMVSARGVICYLVPNPEGAIYKYKIGIKFTDIDRKDSEIIHKYVLKRQREQLKGK